MVCFTLHYTILNTYICLSNQRTPSSEIGRSKYMHGHTCSSTIEYRYGTKDDICICLAQHHYLLGEMECFLLFFVSGDRDRRPLDGEGVWCLLRELGEGECFCRLGEEEGERRFVRAGEWLGLHFLLLLFGEFSRLYLAVREAGITANDFYKYNNSIKSFI